jgi:predicted acyl esterase
MSGEHRRAHQFGFVAKWVAAAMLIGASTAIVASDRATAGDSDQPNVSDGERATSPPDAPQGGTDKRKVSAFGQYDGYSPLTYKQFSRSSIYVPVRDGTRLAIDIYRPAVGGQPVNGKLPTVFEFTRYWRAKALADGRIKTPYFGYLEPSQTGGALPAAPNWAVNLVQHGYVVVVGDNRGTGSSFGASPGPLTATEAKDEHDLIEWMATQPWCDGKIGLTGDSYTGTNEYIALTQRSPHLKAIFPAVSNFELYATAVSGGVFRKGGILSMYNTLVRLGTASQTELQLPPPVDADPTHVLRDKALAGHAKEGFSGYTAFLYSPVLDHVAAELGLKTVEDRIRVLASTSALIPEIADRPDLQRELMSVGYFRGAGSFDFSAPGGEKSISPSSIFDAINRSGVPVYAWSGWRDVAPADGFLFFSNVKTPKKLAVGPWSHYPANKRGDLREEEAIRVRAVEELRWFDYWLKGIDNGIMKEPRINYAVVEGPTTWQWRSANTWPVPEAVNTEMYFQDGRSGSVRSVNDGLLSTTPPAILGAVDSFFVDYKATTGTLTRFHDTTGGGPLFYPDLAQNDAKGLTYTTSPLQHDLTVAGFPIVTLYTTSTAPDAEFSVYLEDIDSYGFSTFLQDGYIRALNRTLGTAPYDNMGQPWATNAKADAERVTPLSQGITTIRFPLQPVAARFKEGHRIRVTIQGADADSNLTFPAVPPPKITIARNPMFPSRITLPVLPADR